MSDTGRPADLIPFAPHYRASGVLVHITSLPSPYGIGDVGPAAFAMVDRLQAAGQTWWQALPLGPTGYGNSPYQSLSSLAGLGIITPDVSTLRDQFQLPGTRVLQFAFDGHAAAGSSV